MNTQGGSRLRHATAIKGKSEIGSQAIHEEPRAISTDSISFASLAARRSLSSRETDFVDSGKVVAICPDEAANQFRAGKMTEA